METGRTRTRTGPTVGAMRPAKRLRPAGSDGLGGGSSGGMRGAAVCGLSDCAGMFAMWGGTGAGVAGIGGESVSMVWDWVSGVAGAGLGAGLEEQEDSAGGRGEAMSKSIVAEGEAGR